MSIVLKYASAEAIELIEGLLQYNPKKRLTCEDALQHRYFTEHLDENRMFSQLGNISSSIMNSPLKSVKTR